MKNLFKKDLEEEIENLLGKLEYIVINQLYDSDDLDFLDRELESYIQNSNNSPAVKYRELLSLKDECYKLKPDWFVMIRYDYLPATHFGYPDVEYKDSLYYLL